MPTLAANKLITVTFDSTSEVVEADVNTMLRLGQQALARRNWALARRYFKRLAELQPDHQEALFNLAALAATPQQTVAYLERILTLNPEHERALKAWRRTRVIISKQLDDARDPVAAISEQIAACYGPSQPFTEEDLATQQATVAERPLPPLPATVLLRVAVAAGNWQLAANIVSGSGVHPDEMRHIYIEAALAERIRCELARQRRRRHAESCYQAARYLCAERKWQAARHQLARARQFLPFDDQISAASMNLIADLERIIDETLNLPPPAAKRAKQRLTR